MHIKHKIERRTRLPASKLSEEVVLGKIQYIMYFIFSNICPNLVPIFSKMFVSLHFYIHLVWKKHCTQTERVSSVFSMPNAFHFSVFSWNSQIWFSSNSIFFFFAWVMWVNCLRVSTSMKFCLSWESEHSTGYCRHGHEQRHTGKLLESGPRWHVVLAKCLKGIIIIKLHWYHGVP